MEPPLTGPRFPLLRLRPPFTPSSLGAGGGGLLTRAHLLALGPAEQEGDGLVSQLGNEVGSVV